MWSSVSLWIIVLRCLVVFGRKPPQKQGGGDGEDCGSGSLARARCASRCLGLHSVSAPLQNNVSLGWCQLHKQCAKCLEPCKESWETRSKSSCRELCERVFPEKQWECESSCEFVQELQASKPGLCPSAHRARGFAAACVESCEHDGECSAHKKCCSNGCGHTCQAPKDMYKGVPAKPRQELALVELSSGQMEVGWSPRSNPSAQPPVYVLQARWNYGIQPSEDTATCWQLAAQSTEHRVLLADIRPGRWYQFRVAAVNTHGTRGFTTPSRHIHASRDPPRPPAPSHLSVANMSLGEGRAVRAQLTWAMAADLDVPVHHYRVLWSWSALGHSAASSTKRRKTVTEAEVCLDSLRANRSYSVEVQAVSYWGQTELKGPRATLQFSTQHTASAAPRSPGDLVDVGMPFYQDGQLRVHVYWQSSVDPSVESYRVQWAPEHCLHNQSRPMEKTRTQKSFVSLQGLLFSCKYKVLVQPMSRSSPRVAVSSSFSTPSCAAIQAKSLKHIACPGEKAPPPKVLVKAANLTASFEVRGGNMTAIFSWDLSPPAPPAPTHQQLTGYQVTWAQVTPTNLQTNNHKLPHSLISQAQILPPDASVLVVSGLHPSSLYRLEVQPITAQGEGPASTRTFQTPGPQTTLKHRPKLWRHHHKQPIIQRH